MDVCLVFAQRVRAGDIETYAGRISEQCAVKANTERVGGEMCRGWGWQAGAAGGWVVVMAVTVAYRTRRTTKLGARMETNRGEGGMRSVELICTSRAS